MLTEAAFAEGITRLARFAPNAAVVFQLDRLARIDEAARLRALLERCAVAAQALVAYCEATDSHGGQMQAQQLLDDIRAELGAKAMTAARRPARKGR